MPSPAFLGYGVAVGGAPGQLVPGTALLQGTLTATVLVLPYTPSFGGPARESQPVPVRVGSEVLLVITLSDFTPTGAAPIAGLSVTAFIFPIDTPGGPGRACPAYGTSSNGQYLLRVPPNSVAPESRLSVMFVVQGHSTQQQEFYVELWATESA